MANKKDGFTLMELIVVVVIIGVLATLGVSQYGVFREKTMGREAVANLNLIAAAEKIYKMESDNNAFIDCQCTTGGDCSSASGTFGCNYILRLSLSPQSWKYNVTASGGGANFKATATRGGCTYEVTDSTDPVPDANTTCP